MQTQTAQSFVCFYFVIPYHHCSNTSPKIISSSSSGSVNSVGDMPHRPSVGSSTRSSIRSLSASNRINRSFSGPFSRPSSLNFSSSSSRRFSHLDFNNVNPASFMRPVANYFEEPDVLTIKETLHTKSMIGLVC